MTEGIRNESIHMEKNHLTRDNTRWLPLDWKEPLFPRRECPFPAPSNDISWYRITSIPQLWPLLATAKINLVLAGTRTIV